MKLKQADLDYIRSSKETQAELAERFKVSQGTISNVQNFRGSYSEPSQPQDSLILTEPAITLEQLCELYGAMDLDDVDLNPGEPESLDEIQMILLDGCVSDTDGMIPLTPQNKKAGNILADAGYVRKREDPKGHKWVLAEDGVTRHALEYYRREYGSAQLNLPPVDLDSHEFGTNQRGPRPFLKPTSFFSPEFEKRVGDQLERLIDHICGKK